MAAALIRRLSAALLALTAASSPALAAKGDAGVDSVSADESSQDDLWQDDGWGDWDEPRGVLWSGFLEAGYAGRVDADALFPISTRSELLLQLEASRAFETFDLDAKLDLAYDHVKGGIESDVRTLTFSLPLEKFGNLVIGRQVLSWGTGDLLFINDRFPKDFVHPLTGRDDFYFKAPSSSLRWSLSLPVINVDFAYTPTFTPDRFIDGERLGFFDPSLGQRVGGERIFVTRRPSGSFENGEFALRLHRTLRGVELAGYLYRGFDKQPMAATADGQATFLPRDAAGASIRGPLAGGIASFEFGRELPRPSARSAARFVPAKTAAMVGFEREWLPKLTVGLQWYAENSDAIPGRVLEQSRQLVSLRATRLAFQDRLRASAILFYSPDEHDRWLRATLSYRLSDRWLTGLTANVFGGPEDRFFGQLEPDSNTGVWLRRQF